ncbi:MAG TPA: 3'-5' exonuclease [Myxococcota bacterium]|nr:3'-5' exonuclease [Myxococcota bacterium]
MVVVDPDAARPLRGAPVAVLDFETTGPDPRACRPVQVAVTWCLLGDTEPEVALQTLIDPGEPIPAEATAVHHISDAMVRGAPRWPDVVPELLRALEGRVLAAFNLTFDWQVLVRGVAETGLDPALVPFGALDPLVWAKVVHRFKKGKRLTDVCERYGVPIAAHDAAADTIATAQVMPKLLHDLGRHKECGPEPLRSVGGMWAWTRRQAVVEDKGFATWCAGAGRPAPVTYWEELLAGGWRPSSS